METLGTHSGCERSEQLHWVPIIIKQLSYKYSIRLIHGNLRYSIQDYLWLTSFAMSTHNHRNITPIIIFGTYPWNTFGTHSGCERSEQLHWVPIIIKQLSYKYSIGLIHGIHSVLKSRLFMAHFVRHEYPQS
jgi:hypothetical protein